MNYDDKREYSEPEMNRPYPLETPDDNRDLFHEAAFSETEENDSPSFAERTDPAESGEPAAEILFEDSLCEPLEGDRDETLIHSYEIPAPGERESLFEAEKSEPASLEGSSHPTFPSEPNPFETKSEQAAKPPKNSTLALLMAITVLLSGASGYAGSYLAHRQAAKKAAEERPSIAETVAASQKETASTTPASSIAAVVSRIADSVVEISTQSAPQRGLFGEPYVGEGAGSGVIIRSDGYIITNQHVIANAQNIKVRLTNGKSYDAVLEGVDSTLDIAVLKIEAEGLTAAVYGDSDKLQVGETAIAIGNPLGELGGTVTSGIISALNRGINVEGTPLNLIQTSAAVNRGNSGGGLFDAEGNLIGIIVAKSASRNFMTSVEGIGFAIPINQAKATAESMIETGVSQSGEKIEKRVQIGIRLAEISDEETAKRYGLKEPGLYIAEITRENGFKSGDRILSMEGKKVTKAEEVQKAVSERKAGDKMRFEIERGGNLFELIVTLTQESE